MRVCTFMPKSALIYMQGILFAVPSSDERKYWGFLLFQQYVQTAPAEFLPVLFGKNFVRCLVNQLVSPERYLHRIAEKSIKAINTRALDCPSLVSVVVDKIMVTNGYINFDIVTKTKTIEKLISQAAPYIVRSIPPKFHQMILHPRTMDEKAASARRQIIADYLLMVVRSGVIQDEKGSAGSDYHEAIKEILAILAKHAYFEIRGDLEGPESALEPPISQASREVFRSRITSSLAHLIAKATGSSGYPYAIVSAIHDCENMDGSTLVTIDTDGSVRTQIKRAWKTLVKVHAEGDVADTAKKELLRAFELLYCLTMLQVYNGDVDAANMLDELQDCYVGLLKHGHGDAQKEGSEILVEILLSLVSKPSLLFRRLALQVFSACTSTITADGLQSMIRVSTWLSKSFYVSLVR